VRTVTRPSLFAYRIMSICSTPKPADSSPCPHANANCDPHVAKLRSATAQIK
jgi:hypothetical protein